MKKLFAISTLALLLTACSGPQQFQKGADATATTATTNAADAPLLPRVALDSNLLFKLLSAEVAAQRGYNQASFITLMSAAQQTKDPRIAKRAAEVALSSHNTQEALDAVRLWVTTAPQSEEAFQNYLSLMILNEQYPELELTLTEKLQQLPVESRRALIIRTQQLFTAIKSPSVAFNILDRITLPYLDLTESHIALSQSAYILGDMVRAKVEAETALSLKPDSSLAVLTLAQALDDPNLATQVIAAFIKRYPKADEVRLAYARELTEQKQFVEAQEQFQILLKNNPDNVSILYTLAVIHIQQKEWNEAKQYLNKYIEIAAAKEDTPMDIGPVQMLLAQVEEEQGHYDTALNWLALAAETIPEDQIGLKRAQILTKLHRIPEARAIFGKLQAESDNPDERARYILAEAQILRENNYPKEAYEVLKKGLQSYPDNTSILYDFAMLADSLKEYRLMEKSLRKVIQIDPTVQHAYNALGYSLAERNTRLPEALALITKAYNLAPNDPFITDSLGWVEYRLGNLERAENYLRRAYHMRNDPEIGIHLGEVLWMKNKKEEARKIWAEAAAKDPNNPQLKETLMRLHVQQ